MQIPWCCNQLYMKLPLWTPCVLQFAYWLESISRVSHGNLQRLNVSVPVSCWSERSNSLFFTPILSFINSPVTVLFCAFLCLSQVEVYRAGVTQATTTKLGINNKVQHCYKSTIWPKRFLQCFFLSCHFDPPSQLPGLG